ncbi:uncharacterized protein LOC134279288 [Saccostrea cucullata]|uniref:uncharacterized protein LOC134279288 n=1 Tax=Saccostrea cuccullata TaxID=36930 RepID=UPI002ED47900
MYQPPTTQPCNHGRKHNDQLPWSAQSLRFPNIQTSQEFERSETFVNGMDARQLVLDEIDDFDSVQRPTSYKKGRIIPHPSTAKLIALSRRAKPAIIPDMTTIFRIYSDQYQPEWMKKPALSKSFLTLSTTSSKSNSESTIVDACT